MTKPAKLKLWLTGAVALAAIIGMWAYFKDGSPSAEDVPVFTVQKGGLQIHVLEGGEIRALQNFEVKSEIEIPTKILSLIPEGYLVTDEDVKNGKVLVELDPSEVKQRIVDHEIQFQTTVAVYIEADEQREIQKSENQSLLRESKQLALFALMDFEKYLGKQAAAGILKTGALPDNVAAFDLQLAAMEAAANTPIDKESAAADDASAAAGGEASPKGASKSKPAASARLNFLPFLESNKLADGEAQQKLRQLGDELLLHKAEEALAKQNYEASQRLEAKKFITRTALENDEVTLEKVKLSVKTAVTALDLFSKYEFPKQCETFLGAYREALHKVQRTIRANRSRMAQVESKFQTAKRRYEVELTKKEDLERQLKACVIKSTQPGLVAYGDLDSSSSYRYSEPIEEGQSVRFRQTILTIPDMSNMGAHVRIHESQVKKVRIGQQALVRIDAEPGKVLDGRVAELAVLPDSSSTRYTPNVKVYPCTIHIAGSHEWIKPGMNAKIEVIIGSLADVLYIPVQSIEVEDDAHFCYVSKGGRLERRPVDTGLFNDEFIEVRSGLESGEAVALALPSKASIEGQKDESEPKPGGPSPVADPAKGKAPAREKKIAAKT